MRKENSVQNCSPYILSQIPSTGLLNLLLNHTEPSRTFHLSHDDLFGTFHLSLNFLGCVSLSVHHLLIFSPSSVSDVFYMVFCFREIPTIIAFCVSTLIWVYLIDVGNFPLICPYQVWLFLMKSVLGSVYDGCVWWNMFSVGCVLMGYV